MIDFITDDELNIEDDEFQVVPLELYQNDLEQRVKEYMAISSDLPQSTIKYTCLKIPSEFKTPEGRKIFWHEEFRRCKEGYEGMCGKMYFFFNFCFIESIGGKIRPQYREIDNQWFKFIEACQNSREWGIVCVKRRRVGASWKEACDVLHDCLFLKNFHVGMNSKSDKDSIWLFRKVKFIYNNLPSELRHPTTSSTKMFIDFSFNDPLSKRKAGNESDILVVAPTDSA